MNRAISPKVWIIALADNVGTVVGNEAPARASIPIIGASTGSIEVPIAIPHGHKVALKPLPSGAKVVKYGVVIGRLIAAVSTGEHVHIHNLESLRGRGDLPIDELS